MKQKEPEISADIVREHGLTDEEYQHILKILGREPSWTELGIFSVMWSEHASYKNSIAVLKTLPRKGGRLLVEAGEENAGLIDIGDGYAIAFKIESHNHPSAVEPYQGAATGVGGILRDIFSMGARPIASLNSLRFGPLDKPRNRYLFQQVVKGIGDYGNCMGVPTVGGEVIFDEVYSGNPLVNAMTIGVIRRKKYISAIAKGKGNPVYIIGSSTGRDGIHGATFASEELSEKSEERKSNVQVGDPFAEKTLLEATLELLGKPWLIGVQDMGAAGITCCSTEMAARGKSGMILHLDRVHLREQGMTPYEIMLSESQERMMIVVRKGFEKDAEAIFDKWEIPWSSVGEVTNDGQVKIFMNGELYADVPADDLVLGGGAPVYYRESKEPAYITESAAYDLNSLPEPDDFNDVLKKLMASPNIASKKWVFEQYDHTVRSNTVIGPGSDAAVIRLKGSQKAIAASTDGNGRYVYLNPYKGGVIAVLESARNVACTGAEPVAITNCLNFGNPYDPEVYYQFTEALRGMGDACKALGTPVTGGNVSFYNESPDTSVFPTPVIGMLGIIENVDQVVSPWFKDEGDFIVILGTLKGELGGTEYLKVIHGMVTGEPPQIDLDFANRLNRAVVTAIREGVVKSAHDLSDGGLAVALAEAAIGNPHGVRGVEVYSMRKMRNDGLLFGETQSVVIVSLAEKKLMDLERISSDYGISSTTIGRVRAHQRLKINDVLDVDLNEIKALFNNSLAAVMEG
jgi:phosphoribosylformylglycinamidine synthase subunit PurL